MSEIREFLTRQLAEGPWTLGQIRIEPGIRLRHCEDAQSDVRQEFHRATDAREIAKYDDAGSYRPLKTAPNLRRGWLLNLPDIEALRLALDFFYPAAVGTWLSARRGDLSPVPLRDTLGRQTGMYRVTQLIRDDQAETLIAKTCGDGCLRERLWTIGSTIPAPAAPTRDRIPVLCAEACNLLVAACRPLAKENLPKPA